jgi:PhnB protein
MPSALTPYLNFRGQARDAMEFYRDALGGELTLSTFGDFGMPVDASESGLIMHGQLSTPAGFLLMGSDTPSHMEYRPGVHTFSVSLSGDDETELRGYWDALAIGAEIGQPLEAAPWGDAFGMLVDRFGVSWLVNIAGARPAE